jgi:hypothetical protein
LFGVIGIIAVLGIAGSVAARLKYGWQPFAFGSLGIFFCGGMLAIITATFRDRPSRYRPPPVASTFVWFCMLLFAIWTILFTITVFTRVPFLKPLDDILGIERKASIQELRKVRDQTVVLRDHAFFSNVNVQAGLGLAEGQILRLATAIKEQFTASGKGDSGKEQKVVSEKKAYLSNSLVLVPGLRSLLEVVRVEKELLEEVFQIYSQRPECLENSVKKLRAFQSRMELILRWLTLIEFEAFQKADQAEIELAKKEMRQPVITMPSSLKSGAIPANYDQTEDLIKHWAKEQEIPNNQLPSAIERCLDDLIIRSQK